MNKDALLERVEKCREILAANPESQIFAALAEAHRKLGDLKAALDVCNDGIRKHPNYGSAYLVLAKIARDQKRFDEAVRSALRAIELEGRTRSAELVLADIYLQTGNFSAAEDLLARLSNADPANQTAMRLLTLARKASKSALIAETFSQSSARIPVGRPREATQAESLFTEIPETQAPTSEPPRTQAPHVETPRITPVLSPPHESQPTHSAPPGAEPWRPVFDSLDRFPHLNGKLAVGYDGLLLDTDIRVRSDAEAAAAMAAELFGAVRCDWPVSAFGAPEQVLVETEQSIWWIWPFAEYILVLWCDTRINMGPLRMRLMQLEGLLLTAPLGGSQ